MRKIFLPGVVVVCCLAGAAHAQNLRGPLLHSPVLHRPLSHKTYSQSHRVTSRRYPLTSPVKHRALTQGYRNRHVDTFGNIDSKSFSAAYPFQGGKSFEPRNPYTDRTGVYTYPGWWRNPFNQ